MCARAISGSYNLTRYPASPLYNVMASRTPIIMTPMIFPPLTERARGSKPRGSKQPFLHNVPPSGAAGGGRTVVLVRK
jgi:hypothetical protein